MAYLQPWMLWALPAVLLPLLIHLLNRLRYKTVHWAAMLFLLKANRSATRRAKLRQYLLLACRMLVILFLIWAMARPLIGGWLGAAAGGAPETVLILLDRSASMEARGADQPESKRAHGLALLAQAAKQSAGSRFILLENVLRQPLEIADASALASLQMAEPTDTAADLPAMFRAALDYLAANKPGSAEVWLASDLQASNWRPESAEWQDVAARFAGVPHAVRVRLLDLSAPPGRNVSVAVKAADLRVRDAQSGKAQLSVSLELKTDADRKGALPLLLTRDGVKSQIDVTLNAALQRQTLKFDLPKTETGWGKIELPADDALADNAAYFVFAPPVPLRVAIVGEGPSAQRLRFAAAPDKARTDRTAELISAARAESINWKETALIIWTAPAPGEAVAKLLQYWVESGGVLLAFPPPVTGASATGAVAEPPAGGAPALRPPDASASVGAGSSAGGSGAGGSGGSSAAAPAAGGSAAAPAAGGSAAAPAVPAFTLTWTPPEPAPKDAPFRVTAWDDLDGPLARTDSGTPLPLARLEVQRRQLPALDDTTHVFASFADGRPFLAGRQLGAGQIFTCATLPETEWSSLGEGFVLLPMVQRILALGGQRLSPPTMAVAGEWRAEPDETWTAIETDKRRDWRWHAGVYQSGARRLALNRPEAEDAPELVESARLPELLRGVQLTVMAGALELKADRLQSEIWPAMIIVAMLAMCAEMLLATSKALLPQKPAAAPRPRAGQTAEVVV